MKILAFCICFVIWLAGTVSFSAVAAYVLASMLYEMGFK